VIEFTDEEEKQIKIIVEDWINDGFLTPPYEEVLYDIFEKLEVEALFYDIKRPKNNNENNN
jgi:hypothetical protein